MDKRLVCNFCKTKRLEEVYQVPESKFKAKIAVCNKCGLVQTVKHIKPVKGKRTISISSGSDWGNIRHGKTLRFQKIKNILLQHLQIKKFKKVLDIGSNRGSFLKWFTEVNPIAEIIAVEPDENIIGDYPTKPNLKLYVSRFEEINFPGESFDFIFCSHTLEHTDSASKMLSEIHRYLKKRGKLFLEVPNIEFIADSDIVEEFFIDKHTFHFNRSLLVDYLEHLSYKVFFGKDVDDEAHITLMAEKVGKSTDESFRPKKNLAKTNKKLICAYSLNLITNRKKIRDTAQTLERFMQRQKVVFWGGGRIFDALIRYGKLDTSRLMYVVDSFLAPYLSKVHGVALKPPEQLRLESPQVVVVLARTSLNEIEQKARSYGIRHVIKFSDLM